MKHLDSGFLLKRRNITYQNRNVEFFEVVDFAVGIGFLNTNSQYLCNVLTGNYSGLYAKVINDDSSYTESDYVFSRVNFGQALEINNNDVDFQSIQKTMLHECPKYYLLKSPSELASITDNGLLSYIEEADNNHHEFDESELEKPTDISTMYSTIKKTIISQDEQIMQILTALFKNQKIIGSGLETDIIAKLKENILIYGSTGTGKTEILKRISKLYNIPIVIEDATSLSETGYVGRSVTDMLEDLYLAANKDMSLAERGILVIDEFDKLAEKSGDNQSHVSRLGVQRSLLKLLDGSLFYFDDKSFDTSKLTIVALGAFTGITEGDDYKHLTTDDFMEYGIMRELMGRFSKTIAMNPLEKEDIVKILKESDFSPLNTYKKLFEVLGVDFDYNDEFVNYLAELADEKKSGARSLKTVFDDCVSSALFRIFAGDYSSISLVKPDDSSKGNPYVLTKKVKNNNNSAGNR